MVIYRWFVRYRRFCIYKKIRTKNVSTLVFTIFAYNNTEKKDRDEFYRHLATFVEISLEKSIIKSQENSEK